MRLLHGIWDAFEGQAFPELNRDVHGVDPFDVPPEWPRYRTFDWGSGAPLSVGWWAVDPEGDLYRYREWYGAKKDENTSVWIGLRMSNAEIARGILERERDASGRPEKVKPGPADPSIWSKRRDKKTGAIGIPIAQELAAEGVTFVQANNERIHGRQQVHSRLRVDPDPAHPDQPGHPKIYTFNNLEHWWRTMLNLRNDTRNIEDVDTDQEDHVYDETRYMCMYKPLRPQVAKPSDANTFQGERRRYIQAKKLAARMGISLERAYRMVR